MSSAIINQIINDQQSKIGNKVVNNDIDNDNLESITTINNDSNNVDNNDSIDNLKSLELKPNTYDNILNEIQEHEYAMEVAIKNADELATKTKESITYFLDIKKPNKHGILINGIPEVLSSAAKLLDLSINGRYKLASMKKMRASILKDSTSKVDGEELTLDKLLRD